MASVSLQPRQKRDLWLRVMTEAKRGAFWPRFNSKITEAKRGYCTSVCLYTCIAVLAQLVERMAFNHVVVGSIPTDSGLS